MHAILFRRRVPVWMRLLCIFTLAVTTMLFNGAYMGSSIDISSTLGVLKEDITMAYYATSVGMAAAYPMVPKMRSLISTKTILLIDLLLQIALSLLCANTSLMGVIIGCSFFIGFLKAFVMMELILMLRPIFSPANERSEFYSYFYPLVFSVSQMALVITAWIAYNYQWQYMYYLVVVLALLSIVQVLFCFRYTKMKLRFPFSEIDWISFWALACALLLFIYVATYGKLYDWFDSPMIVVGATFAVVITYLVVMRQVGVKNPYLRLDVFNYPKAIVAYLFMVLVMFVAGSSTLVSQYVNSVLVADNLHANSLNFWLIPGFFVGGFICFWFFRLQVIRFRILVFFGMMCFSAYLGMIYFGVATKGTYEYLYIPMFLRGLGMMILFIAFGVYAVEGMDPKLMIYNAFFLVAFRSALAPAFSASFYNNMLYRLQEKYVSRLGETLIAQNPIAMERYNAKLNTAMAQGHSFEESTAIAMKSLYSSVSMQATLLSIKEIVGYILILCLIVGVISVFIPFHKTLKVKVEEGAEDMV